jgi:glucose-1-phosphate cytidylyltransferase
MTAQTDTGTVTLHHRHQQDGTVGLVDTGQETATVGRIKRLKDWMGQGTVVLTWGDGAADVDLDALLRFRHSYGRLTALTAARPPARFGHLEFDRDQVNPVHREAPDQRGLDQWRGAFFVLEPEIFDYIDGDATEWEKEQGP